ncbi:MAG: hypothetical protein OXG62_11865 [Nitrospinae bacterium]|nr:hypothetical protein [Nitrospinota bacterium]
MAVLGPGDVWYVPPHIEHQTDYLEDTVAFEAAGPIQLDNFAGYLHEDTHFVDQRDLAADLEREQAG